jgi:EAL domain-containing protein (putative c-di-GMP-specific phosphodiesterase class I)/GGDEF domain-containing protein
MTSEATPAEPYEAERLEALRSTNLLSSANDPVFDRLTQLAARLLDMPLASISLVDDSVVWLKSAVGFSTHRFPRSQTFCAHAVRRDEIMLVADATLDPRFASNPFVVEPPHIRFYAGAPLKTAKGHRLGTLCVLDTRPRPDFQARELAILSELADLVSAWIKMRESAGYLDAATGIFTRGRMLEVLADELRRPISHQDNRVRLVGIVDITVPKQMHDLVQVMGHDRVDQFIVECINRLSRKIGIGEDLYRIGLFRFGFLMTASAGSNIHFRLDALVKTLHEPFDSGLGLLLAPSAKLGVTMLTNDGGATAENVFRQASVAADDAWESSRSWTFFKPQSDAARQRKLALLTELPGALIAEDQLYLAYQPQIELATRECVGVEALLRWQHPQLGQVSPIELIDAAEKTTLMGSITDWVLDAAIAQCAQWHAAGLSLRVAVNLSAHDLSDVNIVTRVAERLERHGLAGANLELEFTESTLIRDIDAVLPKLRQLHELGVTTAIDDFGTGYCNLSYLQKLDASRIKVDRSFVQTLEDNPRGQTLTRAIINLAHELDHQIVAEGIENHNTLAMVTEWGCEQAQGYLFSRPVSSDALVEWIAAGGAKAAAMPEPHGKQRNCRCA